MSKTPYLKSQTRQTDWCVVIPKLPETLEGRVAERLIQHFSLTPQEAEETIQHTPIILLDDLDHETASKVSAIFDGTGVQLVLTQDPSFKKKCFRVLWPKESAEVLSRWKADVFPAAEEIQPRDVTDAVESSAEALPEPERGPSDMNLKKRISELEARLKIAEARDKELQGELAKREKNSRSREEVLQQEKKVSQKLQGLFDQGQKEGADWMRKAERAQERVKALEAEKNELSEKLQARAREIGNWKVKSDQLDAEREDLTKQLAQKNRELEQRQRAFEQQLTELDKKNAREKTGYVDEKKQWSSIHEQFQQELQAAQQKSAELTEQIKALRRNIHDREEASKLSAQTFKDVSRRNQALQQKMTQLEGQAVKAEKVREDLTRQLTQVSAELGEKQKLYESAVAVYEKRIETLAGESKAERDQFAEERQSLNQTLENLRGEIESLGSQKSAVQNCLTETEKRCGQLTDSLDLQAKDYQALAALVEQLKQTESRLQGEIQKLQSQLEAVSQDRIVQESSLSRLTAKVSELEQLSSRQETLLQKESSKLAQEKDTAEHAAARIRQLESEHLHLEKLLEVSNTDYQRAVEKITELEKNLSSLTASQKDLESNLGQTREALDRWRQSSEEAQSESASRQERIDELSVLKKHTEDERDKLAADKAELENYRAELLAQVQGLTQTRGELDSQTRELQSQIDDLSSSLQTLRANLDKRTQDLEASLREREKQGAEWSVKYNELKEMADAERDSLRQEQARLESVLQAVREERTAALKDVSDLESRTAELEQKQTGLALELADKKEQLAQWTLFAEQAESKADERLKKIGEFESLTADLRVDRDAFAKAKEQLESEKDSLQTRLSHTTDERDQLILLRQKLESELTGLQENSAQLAEDLKTSIQQRETQVADWSSRFKELQHSSEDERLSLLEEKQQLLKTLDGLSDDKVFAQKTIAELEMRLSELHETRTSLERDLHQKTETLARETVRADESGALAAANQKKIEQLEDQVIQLEVERHELMDELSKVKSDLDETLLQKKNLEVEVDHWSSEANELASKFEAESNAHEASRSRQAEQNLQWEQKFNELAEKSAEDREVFEDERARYEKVLAEIKTDKAEALKEIGRLEERIIALDLRRKGLEEQLAAKSADYEKTFSVKVAELQRWIQHSEEVEAESAARSKRIEELEAAAARLENDLQKLTEALAVTQAARDSAQTEREALQAAYRELEGKREALQVQLTQKTEALQKSLETKAQLETDWSARFNDLKNTSDVLRVTLLNEKSGLEAALAELGREKTQSLQRMEAQDKAIETLDSQRCALEHDLKTKIEELQQWSRLAEEASAESDARGKQIEALETAKAGLEAERSALLAAKEILESQAADFEKHLAEAALERERLLGIKQGLEKSVSALESQQQALREELKQRTEKLSMEAQEQGEQTAAWTEKYETLKIESEAQHKGFAAELQRLEAVLGLLQTEKSEALKEIGRLEGRIESVEETRDQLEQSLRVKTEELVQWTQLAEQNEAKAEERQKNIDALRTERDSLSAQNAELKNKSEAEQKRLHQMIESLQAEKTGALRQIQQLDGRLTELSGERQALEQELKLKGEELEQWSLLAEQNEVKADERQKTIEGLLAERDSLSAQKEELTGERDQLLASKNDLEAEREELTRKLAQLTSAGQTLSGQKENLELEVEKLETRSRELSQELESARREGLALDAQWNGKYAELKNTGEAEQKRLHQTIESLQTEKTGAMRQIQQLDGRLAELSGERQALEQELKLKGEELEQWSLLAEQNEVKADERQKTIEGLLAERDSLSAQKEELTGERDQLLAAKNDLEKEREELTRKLAQLTSAGQTLSGQKENLELEVEKLETRSRELSQELESARREGLALDAQWNGKYAELKNMGEAEQKRLHQMIESLQADKTKSLQQIKRLDGLLTEMTARREALEQEFKLKTEEVSQWAQLAEQGQSKAEELQGKINDLEKVKGELESQRDDLFLAKAQLEDQRDKLLLLKAELESERTAFADQLVEMTEARNQLARIKQGLESKAETLSFQETALSEELEKVRRMAAQQDAVWTKKHNAANESFTKERKTLLEKQTQLESAIQRLEKDKVEALREIEVQQSRIQELNRKYEDLERGHHLKSEELSRLDAQRQTLEAEVKKLESHSSGLSADLEKRSQELEAASHEALRQETRWKLESAELQASFETKLESLNHSLERVKEDKETALTVIQQLESRISDLSGTRETLAADLDARTGEVSRLAEVTAQNEIKILEWQEKLEALQREREALTLDKSALAGERDQLLAAKHDLEKERETLLAAKSQLEEERTRFANKLTEVSQIRDSLEHQKKKSESEAKKLSAAIQRMNTDLEGLTRELAEAAAKHKTDTEAWSAQAGEMRDSAEAQRKALLVEQDRLKDALQSVSAEQLKAVKTIKSLETRLGEYEQQFSRSALELQKKNEELQQWARLAEQVEGKAEDWHKQVDELERAKHALESQCEALRAAKAQLDDERLSAEQRLAAMTEERDRAVSQRQSLEMNFKEIQSRQQLAQEALSGKERELEVSLNSRAEAEKKWSEKFAQLSKESAAENQELSEEIDRLKNSLKSLKVEKINTQKEIEELEHRGETLEQERARFEQQLLSRTAELKKLSDWAAQAEIMVKDQQRKMETLEAVKADIARELEEVLEAKNSFEADLRDSTSELNRMTQRLGQAETSLESEVKRAAELEAARSEAEARCEKIETEMKQMVREKKLLVQQVVEIQAGLNSLEMENNLTSLQSRRKFLEAELDARAKDVEKWMESARLAEGETQKLKDEQQAGLKKQEALEKQCAELQDELKNLRAASKQLGQKDKEITRLEAELKAAAASRDTAVQDAKFLAEQSEMKAAALLKDWDQRYQVMKSAITREREEFERERAELRGKQDKLRKLDEELSQASGKIAELEASRHELQKKLTEMQSESSRNAKPDSDEEQGRLRKELETARQEIGKLTEKYHALEGVKNEFVGLLGAERQRFDALQNQYDQLKDRFGELVRKQTESAFDRPLKLDNPRSSAAGGEASSENDKMLRLKQILDFEDKRGGSQK